MNVKKKKKGNESSHINVDEIMGLCCVWQGIE